MHVRMESAFLLLQAILTHKEEKGLDPGGFPDVLHKTSRIHVKNHSPLQCVVFFMISMTQTI